MKNITINEVEEIAGVRIETINELKHGEHPKVTAIKTISKCNRNFWICNKRK